MRQPSRRTVSSQMSTDRINSSETDEGGDVLAIVRGEFQDRQVDWKVRSHKGTLQNACDYYDEGKLIRAGDWFRFEFVDISESGDTVQFSDFRGGGELPFEDWIDAVAEGYLEDELGEIWNDVKQMHDDEQVL